MLLYLRVANFLFLCKDGFVQYRCIHSQPLPRKSYFFTDVSQITDVRFQITFEIFYASKSLGIGLHQFFVSFLGM